MTEYRFHWRPSGSKGRLSPSVTLEAESRFEGASVALRQFVQLGCEISAPLAHIDMTDPDGVKHTLLVEEVLDWLKDSKQATFVQRAHLGALLRERPES